MNMKRIALSSPDIGDREVAYVARVLRSQQLSLGPVLNEFERAFADYIGTGHAIAASSGTSALHMCVKAMGLGKGTEVLTSSFSFVASVNCLLYEGAYPRLTDIDPLTLNLSPDCVREFLKSKCYRTRKGEVIDRSTGLVVKAILPVHVFGLPADMNEFMAIANEYGLAILEDACEAIGAEYQGRRVGTFGEAAVFAFYPNKQMTTGEGGMVVTNNLRVAESCRRLRNQGRDTGGTWLKHVALGYNYRMSDVHAALGLAQLERIEELLGKRERVALRYIELLAGEIALRLPLPVAGTKRSWFVFVVQANGAGVRGTRDALRQHLEQEGIASQVYFPAIHQQPYYRELGLAADCHLPATEHASATCLALPFSSRLSDDEAKHVAQAVGAALRHSAEGVCAVSLQAGADGKMEGVPSPC
jgi:dTDP-4-amino-4,6-dideoxygalactose transaminase